MSHIVVHRIERRALQRLGRLEQIRALAPFPARHDGNYWDSRADRYVHLMPAAIGGELGAVYMEIPEQEETPGAPMRIRPASSTRSPTLSGSARGVPEQLCYQLHLITANPHPGPASVSTPPIPWPCVIVGANLQYFGGNLAVIPAWGLTLTDADYTLQFIEPTGEPLIELLTGAIPGVDPNLSITSTTPVPIPVITGAGERALTNPAAQLLGKIIHTAGRRITFTCASDSAAGEVIDLTLTLQQIGGTRAAATFIPAAQRAAPRVAFNPNTRTTTRVAPAPTPAPGECIISPQTALQQLQLERNGPDWFRAQYRGTTACGFAPIFDSTGWIPPSSPPSLARALQLLAEGRAPVTLPYRVGPGDTAIAAGQIQFESLRQIEARKAIERARAGPLIPTTGPLGGG